MKMTEQNIINPWIGLDSYREGQVLYGRNREIQDLSMAVFYNRQTVVYGKSGIGKSSLLHAGIFPMARLRGFLPISVRFDHATEVPYRAQLFQRITEAVQAAGGEMKDTMPEMQAPQSLWEFFHRMQPMQDGQEITPLIVIDQFEEIFTLAKSTRTVRAFFDELGDLFNDMMPKYLQADHALEKTAETGSIFDGLQLNPTDNRFDREMQYRMVFVLREDYLSYLERYAAHVPALKHYRYGLLPVTYTQAMEIITKPRPGLVPQEVADAIIRRITTEAEIHDDTPVDTTILSLYMSRLYEQKKEATVISMQLVQEQGDALIEDFYAQTVASVDETTVTCLEDVLINAEGHRENITMESLSQNRKVRPAAIQTLEHAHLLRLFSYGNVQRVEYAHDVLCPVIMRRRSQRQNAMRIRRMKRIGIGAFIAFLLIIAAGVIFVEQRVEKKAALERQQARLTQMETSLIERGAQKMIADQDLYGAIRLLLNSIQDTQKPSPSAARLEAVLREAVDSLNKSENPYVGKIPCNMRMFFDEDVFSPSRRLLGMNIFAGYAIVVDAHTGAVVQILSKDNAVQFGDINGDVDDSHVTLYIRDGRMEVFETDDRNDVRLTDIHPNDSLCLLATGDTALVECILRSPKAAKNGLTRLCIRDLQSPVDEAAYDATGEKIAIRQEDGSLALYEAKKGKRLQAADADEQAEAILRAARRRCIHTLQSVGSNARQIVPVDGTIQIEYNYATRFIRILRERRYEDHPAPFAPTADQLIRLSKEQDKALRDQIESLPLPATVSAFRRSYDETTGERYPRLLAASPDGSRIVLQKPVNEVENGYHIYGIYAHNGAVFFHQEMPCEIQTLHFAKDNRHVVVNFGQETQEVFDLPTLEQLAGSCKQLFFDWKMTDDERYQTYIHMND